MDKRQLDSQFYVSDQITAEDVASLAAGGFKTIICNRPDGEAPHFSAKPQGFMLNP